MQSLDTIERKNPVAIAIANHEWARGNERRHLRIIPAIRVDGEHAVAMTLDGAIDHVIAQIGNASDRCGDFDPVIERPDPPTVGATPGAASNAETVRVDVRPGA